MSYITVVYHVRHGETVRRAAPLQGSAWRRCPCNRKAMGKNVPSLFYCRVLPFHAPAPFPDPVSFPFHIPDILLKKFFCGIDGVEFSTHISLFPGIVRQSGIGPAAALFFSGELFFIKDAVQFIVFITKRSDIVLIILNGVFPVADFVSQVLHLFIPFILHFIDFSFGGGELFCQGLHIFIAFKETSLKRIIQV
jgi:hypothetical protein